MENVAPLLVCFAIRAVSRGSTSGNNPESFESSAVDPPAGSLSEDSIAAYSTMLDGMRVAVSLDARLSLRPHFSSEIYARTSSSSSFITFG